jgi:epoxyqueuosine reductase
MRYEKMMNAKRLYDHFKTQFDAVGIIKTQDYLDEATKMNREVPKETYPTMVVLGLAYPFRMLKHSQTHLVPSFYTFGSDYHQVLKHRIEIVMQAIPYPYHMGVDNHPHDERLAAVLGGLGFFGKNQLIIHPDLGSYMFLGLVFIDVLLDDTLNLKIDDDCGTCHKCIDACPTQALEEGMYHVEKCMSYFNQAKKHLTDEEVEANYSLFGCDICQMVCPKNIKKGAIVHPEFELSGKEMVSIMDLFQDSEKAFKKKYDHMAYLWKGKTILMRNAVMLLYRFKNTHYNDMIARVLKNNQTPWFAQTTKRLLEKLKQIQADDTQHSS